MKQRRLQTLCIPILLIMVALLSSCGVKEETTVGYDFQINMVENTAYSFADTESGLLFAKDYYLYSLGDTAEPKPVCIRGGCLHDKDTKVNINCDAFIEHVKGMYYYDEHLYVFADSGKAERCLTEYTTNGIFVRSVSVLPNSAENMLQHRGAFYYSFDSDGTAVIVKLRENDGKSSVIYKCRYESGSLEPVLAYDRFVYIRETDLSGEHPVFMLVYDTERNEVAEIETDKVIIREGELIYDKNTDATHTIWTSKLNGQKQRETEFVLKSEGNLLCAFDNYIIVASRITADSKTQYFTVYKNEAFFFEFTLENVDGRNWSMRPADSVIWTDGHLFILPMTKDGDYAIAEIDKAEFEKGAFSSHIIFEPGNY